jgi:hypothetical protein
MTTKGPAPDDAGRVAEVLAHRIDFFRDEARERGDRFEALGQDELIRKITGETSNSPYFYAVAWGSPPVGSSTTITTYIHNPDPDAYSGYSLFGYLFFGPINIVPDPAQAVCTPIDTQFPYSYQRLGVAAGADANATFTVPVGSSVQPGIYMANCFLLMRGSFDTGRYVDRVCVDMTVRP